MSLRDLSGEKPDLFTRVTDGAFGGHSHVLVPLAHFADARTHNPHAIFGLDVPNTTKLNALLPYLEKVELIGIAFPSFADGRGFSLAKALREAGYRGVLRAVGPLIADQFAYALACGFDEVELPPDLAARQSVEVWQAAARSYRATYQSTHQPEHRQNAGSILERRRHKHALVDGHDT